MINQNLTFTITFEGYGWSTLCFSSDQWSREFHASYIGDSPFDFLIAFERLDNEDDPSTLSFDAEPQITKVAIEPSEESGSNPHSLEEAYNCLIQLEICQEGEKSIKFLIPFQQLCKLYIQALDREIDRLGFLGMVRSWASPYSSDLPIGLYLKYKAIALGHYEFIDSLKKNEDDSISSSLKDELRLIEARLL